jgi:carboxyl-terminal processing protease
MISKYKIIILLFITGIIAMTSSVSYSQEKVQSSQMKFGRLLRLIDGYYVDSADVDKLTENAIVHILGELDPHSVYISRNEVEKMNEPLEGNFEGIGITFTIYKDTLLVTSIVPSGPSEKVGLRPGDRIIEVDEKNIAGIGLKNSDVLEMLRGKKGTTVEIKVVRNKRDEIIDFTIIRDKIPIYSLDASYMLDKYTGFIKLNKFSATTLDEFTEAMEALREQNVKNLILDLRGNGGGYLKTAIDISDQFLADNRLIVYTSGMNEPKREYNATSKGIFEEGNLIVLIDETSASASEIVTGAVQDWDRGVVIGRRSFGKGLVQKPYYLTDRSVVRLTTAHYYTPSGRCIQKPYENGVTEYRSDYLERLKNGELFSQDSIAFNDSLKYRTLVNDRLVYGGGGIMPDIFIPLDTSSHYAYLNRLRRNNIVYNFVLDYVDTNREKIVHNYPEFEQFEKNFEVNDEMVDNIVEAGEKEGIEKNIESMSFTLSNMKKEIKALIARDIYDRNAFYKIFYEDDEALKRALAVINNPNQYSKLLVTAE